MGSPLHLISSRVASCRLVFVLPCVVSCRVVSCRLVLSENRLEKLSTDLPTETGQLLSRFNPETVRNLALYVKKTRYAVFFFIVLLFTSMSFRLLFLRRFLRGGVIYCCYFSIFIFFCSFSIFIFFLLFLHFHFFFVKTFVYTGTFVRKCHRRCIFFLVYLVYHSEVTRV